MYIHITVQLALGHFFWPTQKFCQNENDQNFDFLGLRSEIWTQYTSIVKNTLTLFSRDLVEKFFF